MGGLLAVVMARAAAVPRLQAAALQVLLARGGDLVARLTTAPLISVLGFEPVQNKSPASKAKSTPVITRHALAHDRANLDFARSAPRNGG